MEQKKVICPNCGYKMPIYYDPATAKARGLYVRCKGRQCGRQFEIRLPAEKEEKIQVVK